MDLDKLLIELCKTAGAPGYEAERSLVVRKLFAEFCDDVSIDKLGNVIGLRRGTGHGKIMLSAHIDVIALMVSGIFDNGFLGFTPMGFFDGRTLCFQEVTVHGSEKLLGVIGAPPIQLVSEGLLREDEPEYMTRALKLEDMFVDVGLTAEEAREKVRIGDIITINSNYSKLINGRLACKALDDSAGIACIISALQNLKGINLEADLYVVASVQEEVGARGAQTAAYGIQPDIAIAVDVGFARATGTRDEEASDMGKGPDISSGPNISRRVYEQLRETAVRNDLHAQYSVIPGGCSGTDAYTMQIAGAGFATGVVSIPIKYLHSSVEMAALSDIADIGMLLARFAESFNGADMEKSLCL